MFPIEYIVGAGVLVGVTLYIIFGEELHVPFSLQSSYSANSYVLNLMAFLGYLETLASPIFHIYVIYSLSSSH